jgi:TatD DNase family protein
MTLLAALDLIDTHAHLDDEGFAGEADRLVAEAAEIGVRRIVHIGYRPSGWENAVALERRFPGVSYTLGIHPNHASEATDANLARLREMVLRGGPVAIGETGLDYFRDWEPPRQQRVAFEAQIRLAAESGLPVIVHQRGAEADTIAAIRAAPADVTFILHSFEGSDAYLRLAIERGCAIGVGGLMTRSGSGPLRTVLQEAPGHLLLLETDAPYLKPAGLRGARNEPRNLTAVAAKLAGLRGVTVEQIAALTNANAERIFARLPAATPARGL